MEGYSAWSSPSTDEVAGPAASASWRGPARTRGSTSTAAELQMEDVAAAAPRSEDVDAGAGAADVVVRRPRVPAAQRAASEANRRSVVILSVDAPGKPPRAGTGAGAESGDADGAANRKSRFFPDVELQATAQKGPRAGEEGREPVYVEVARWPWVLVASTLWLGSLVCLAFGALCINQFYAETVGEQNTVVLAACGPAGGSGGIAMLIVGIGVLVGASWQLWRLRTPTTKFIGYKPAGSRPSAAPLPKAWATTSTRPPASGPPASAWVNAPTELQPPASARVTAEPSQAAAPAVPKPRASVAPARSVAVPVTSRTDTSTSLPYTASASTSALLPTPTAPTSPPPAVAAVAVQGRRPAPQAPPARVASVSQPSPEEAEEQSRSTGPGAGASAVGPRAPSIVRGPVVATSNQAVSGPVNPKPTSPPGPMYPKPTGASTASITTPRPPTVPPGPIAPKPTGAPTAAAPPKPAPVVIRSVRPAATRPPGSPQ